MTNHRESPSSSPSNLYMKRKATSPTLSLTFLFLICMYNIAIIRGFLLLHMCLQVNQLDDDRILKSFYKTGQGSELSSPLLGYIKSNSLSSDIRASQQFLALARPSPLHAPSYRIFPWAGSSVVFFNCT